MLVRFFFFFFSLFRNSLNARRSFGHTAVAHWPDVARKAEKSFCLAPSSLSSVLRQRPWHMAALVLAAFCARTKLTMRLVTVSTAASAFAKRTNTA